ncbi:MAG: cysteine desulfurase [Oscillospiraceae bacterium]|nr:cysteine desulfurase [Oscillospiraceae bacterium]
MREIYLDNCATTRVDKDAAELAAYVMQTVYGNPSSLHKKGIEAEAILTEARRRIAIALGCAPDNVYFTSGGTESNNLAIFGAASANKRTGNTIITTAWEHSSALNPVRELESRGFVVKAVSPEPSGHIDIDKLAALTDGDTVLVSCMMVNSELGSVADIERLVKLVKLRNSKTLVHCDAVQGFGKLSFSAERLGVDMLSVSGHKTYAPKGVGALYMKKTARVAPLFFGGGQEKLIRPGTEALPLIAAFGLAAEAARNNFSANLAHLTALFKHFVKNVALTENLCMNSPPDSTPYICNASLLGFRSETVLHYLAAKGIYVSSGSACGKGKPSYMLKAAGVSRARIDSALRISFSKHNTIDDVDAFFLALSQAQKEIVV